MPSTLPSMTNLNAPVAAREPDPDLAQHAYDARQLAKWAFIAAAFGAFFALLAALFAGYTAYVVYRVLQALEEALQGVGS